MLFDNSVHTVTTPRSLFVLFYALCTWQYFKQYLSVVIKPQIYDNQSTLVNTRKRLYRIKIKVGEMDHSGNVNHRRWRPRCGSRGEFVKLYGLQPSELVPGRRGFSWILVRHPNKDSHNEKMIFVPSKITNGRLHQWPLKFTTKQTNFAWYSPSLSPLLTFIFSSSSSYSPELNEPGLWDTSESFQSKLERFFLSLLVLFIVCLLSLALFLHVIDYVMQVQWTRGCPRSPLGP